MNRLQAIPNPGEPESPGRVFVSMNPIRTPHLPRLHQVYYHPILDSKSIQASRSLPLINAASNISFAGAWMGYGFHEDGFAAGLEAARKIVTGNYDSPSNIRYGADLADWVPKLSTADKTVRGAVAAIQFMIERVEWLAGSSTQ
jgi:predicted NAD/FAD-binding protein